MPWGLAGFEHVPVAGLQVPASWHWSCAVQLTGFAPVQVPAWHVSVCVQASPSLQAAPLGLAGLEHAPVAGLQVPASLPRSGAGQVTGFAPVHAPAWQVSVRVQALPSSHAAVFGAWTQPVAAVQESSVHGLPSSQFGGGPPTHLPPAHVSPVVQALPSSQRAAFALFTQPVVALQTSSVQAFPSSQLGAGPPTQRPPVQVSAVVQAFPSSQGAVFGVLTQPVAGSQESSVHGLPSSQLSAAPTQRPPEQVSAVVQAFPS